MTRTLPVRGERVVAIRQSGQRLIARREYPIGSLFRRRDKLDWLTDGNKFASVGFDLVVGWEPLPDDGPSSEEAFHTLIQQGGHYDYDLSAKP